MSTQVGIILPNLGASQLLHEVVGKINQTRGPYTVYYEDIYPTYVRIHAPLMNITESKYFSGRLIATTLSSADYILSSLQHNELIFYIYDLEWLRGKTDYVANQLIYRNPKLKLYTRCKEYAELIKQYTNRDVGICGLGELM